MPIEQEPVLTEKQLAEREPVFDGLFDQKGQVFISPSLRDKPQQAAPSEPAPQNPPSPPAPSA